MAFSYRELTRPSTERIISLILYSRGTDTHHRKHMSRDYNPPMRDVTGARQTQPSLLLRVGPLLHMLPGNALINSVTVLKEPLIVNER
jgi:hypothetical protein